ncbi:Translation initiation factor IF-3 [Lachnellula cervina]|uniref:Translation initiation factor IF-3 n=1 Tax=Lachnellula cervina TaxID=1316786 RepID=A0A7D8YXC0_9HELO|nr:Translation initiation factor IF-3 [Lachnellula cervina]
MKLRHFSGTATALHRVFIAPIELQPRLFRALPPTLSHQQRNYASPPKPKVEKSRLPTNDEISARSITLVTADGKLSAPQNTRSVLSSLDQKTHVLTMVVEGTEEEPPICKVLNRAELYAAEKERRKRKKDEGKGKSRSKELEMNWAIEKGDEKTKMRKLVEWVGRGWKVEVTLAKKRKGRVAGEEECEALVGRLKGVLAEGGGKEFKPAEGKVGGVLTIYCEGKKGGSVVEKEKGTQDLGDNEPIQEDETTGTQDEDDTENSRALSGAAN